MSQGKIFSPSVSTHLHLFFLAPLYAFLSFLCVLLLAKTTLWQSSIVFLPTRPQVFSVLPNSIRLSYEFLLVGLLTLTLERGLRLFRISAKNSLRGGFLGAWIASLLTVSDLGKTALSLALGEALVGFLAAFGAALVATATHTALWEENLPPAAETQQRVVEQHRLFLGAERAAPAWKRALDLCLCLLSAPFAFPLAVLIAWGIWLEDPGAIFFVKNSVGKWGKNFRQVKFRTMIQGAELGNGPRLALENDPRALRFGRLLRKTALDELPQLWNILRGEMSFVGPRPQRTALVDQYLQSLPQYAERHRLPPGLSGLAQVAGSYYLTPLQKLRFDRLYIHHASLGYDLRLLLTAFALTFYYRWKPGWKGRLPRRWLHPPKPVAGVAKRSRGQC